MLDLNLKTSLSLKRDRIHYVGLCPSANAVVFVACLDAINTRCCPFLS